MKSFSRVRLIVLALSFFSTSAWGLWSKSKKVPLNMDWKKHASYKRVEFTPADHKSYTPNDQAWNSAMNEMLDCKPQNRPKEF
jgi:hypothetical protein